MPNTLLKANKLTKRKPRLKSYDDFEKYLEAQGVIAKRNVFNYEKRFCYSSDNNLSRDRLLIKLENELVSPSLRFSKITRWFDAYCENHKAEYNPIADHFSRFCDYHKQWISNDYLDLLLNLLSNKNERLKHLWLLALSQQVFVSCYGHCSADFVPILWGKQGAGKSRFLAALCNFFKTIVDGENLFLGEVPAACLYDKDTKIELVGHACVELAEIETTLRRNSSGLAKAFLTRSQDQFRRPYERTAETFDRYCVFWGTTNCKEILKDLTGNRRFVVLPFNFEPKRREEIINFLTRFSEHIWFEIMRLGFPYRLSPSDLIEIEINNQQYMVKPTCYLELQDLIIPEGDINWTGTVSDLKMLYPTILGNYSVNSISRALKKIPGVQYKKNNRMLYSLCLADRVDRAALNSNL